MAAGRTGRRPGDPALTRQAILEAARTAFADHGYESTSIRRVAGDADVDPALVHHYFGSKEDLFLAALDVPVTPDEVLSSALAGGADEVGERLVRTFLSIWDSPRGAAAAAMLRSAVAHPWIAKLLREFILNRVAKRALSELGISDQVELRASLVASQMLGLALTRHLLDFEPIASAQAETVVAALAPTIQRYVTGDISAEPAASVRLRR
ncbi:MAG: TetR family transcriptional regulator [Actinomycetota bacterium]|nr:TetR family transcriptional regulator [Actinomycetota bacterium]